MSRIPGPTFHKPFSPLLPPRTPGSLGRSDAADSTAYAAIGDTPGPVGVNDHAAHLAVALGRRGKATGKPHGSSPSPISSKSSSPVGGAGSGATVSMSAVLPDHDAIDEALAAFEASVTGKTTFGSSVASKLRGYFHNEDIGYDPLTPNMYGLSVDKNLAGKSIRVNDRFRGNIPGTSVALAHEGVHRVINDWSLDEELSCRELQDDYYTELIGGIWYTSPTTGNKTNAKITYFPEAQDLSKWRKKDQVVDFVLSRGEIYWGKLTAKWINTNIAKWGGLNNRWATTKGIYIRVLGSDITNGQMILDILSSVKTQAEWDEMIRMSGGVDNARQALHVFKTAPVARVHMLAIQNQWKVDLGAK